MRSILLLIVSVLAISCSSQEPGPAIPADVLVEVLSELHLADSRLLVDPSAPDSLRELILSRHDVSEEALDASLTYLSEHPAELAELYGKIVDQLVEDGD